MNVRETVIPMVALAVWLHIGAAQAFCLNPLGCSPSNYDECVDDATKRPTDTGVRLAKQQCHDKFVKPELERKARAEALAAEVLATNWAKVGTSIRTEPELRKLLGPASSVSGPNECTPVDRAVPPGRVKCLTLQWIDRRPGRICTGRTYVGIECYFVVEVCCRRPKTEPHMRVVPTQN